jgi:hypothetical protein
MRGRGFASRKMYSHGHDKPTTQSKGDDSNAEKKLNECNWLDIA